jgi:hypothetical protein
MEDRMVSDELLASVASRLACRADELAETFLQRVRSTVRAYDAVSDADIRRSLKRNVARVVAAIEQHEQLPPDIEEDERATGKRRALQGIPSEFVVDAYRSHLSALRDAFIDEAVSAGLDLQTVLTGTLRLWNVTDKYTNVLIIAHHEAELEAARRDEQRRLAFLQRLLTGGLEPAELQEGGAVLGVLTNTEYWVFRGRQHDGGTHRLTRHLETCSPGSHVEPLVGPVDADVAGISTSRPRLLDGAVVAVAGPADVSAIPGAFAEATRVLHVALRYQRTGIVDSSSLSVRIAVEQQAELGEFLFRRYITAMSDRGAMGAEILDTVRSWIQQRRSIAATARSLSIHDNSVRYRIARFCEVTGADLDDSDSLVEVWWALEYASIRQRADRDPSARTPSIREWADRADGHTEQDRPPGHERPSLRAGQ